MSDSATLKVYAHNAEPWHKWLAYQIMKLVKIRNKQDKSYDKKKKKQVRTS